MALARNDVSVALLAACLPLPSFCLVLVKSTAGFVALRLVPMVEKKRGPKLGVRYAPPYTSCMRLALALRRHRRGK